MPSAAKSNGYIPYCWGRGSFRSSRAASMAPPNDETPIAAEPMALDFGVQLCWQGDSETGVPNLCSSGSNLLPGAAA